MSDVNGGKRLLRDLQALTHADSFVTSAAGETLTGRNFHHLDLESLHHGFALNLF